MPEILEQGIAEDISIFRIETFMQNASNLERRQIKQARLKYLGVAVVGFAASLVTFGHYVQQRDVHGIAENMKGFGGAVGMISLIGAGSLGAVGVGETTKLIQQENIQLKLPFNVENYQQQPTNWMTDLMDEL